MKGIFLTRIGFPSRLCCKKSSPMLTGILVKVYIYMTVVLFNNLLTVLLFGCVARCRR